MKLTNNTARFVLFISFMFFYASAWAQPSIGISAGMTKHLGEFFIDLTPTGRVSLFTTIKFKDKFVGKYGASYTFTARAKTTYTLDPIVNGLVQPRDADYIFKLHGPSINAQTRYYAVGDYYSKISMYIPVDVGLHILFADGQLDKYNKALYKTPEWYDGPQKDLLLGFSIGAGIGAEFQIGLPVLFLESQFVFPVNSVNGQPIEPQVPMHVIFDVGLRIPIDPDYQPGARYRHRRLR